MRASRAKRHSAGNCDIRRPAQLLAPLEFRINGVQALRCSPIHASFASDFSGRNERTGEFIAALNGVITHASSSIKFCRVAEGAADFYPRFGDVSEWDAAAGHAILKAAGGDIMLPGRLASADTAADQADDFLVRMASSRTEVQAAKNAALNALRR